MFVRTYPAYSASNVRYVSYPRPGGQKTVADDIRRSMYWSWGIRSFIDRYSPVQCGKTVRNGEIDERAVRGLVGRGGKEGEGKRGE